MMCKELVFARRAGEAVDFSTIESHRTPVENSWQEEGVMG
jgi:hypothetical protein